MKLVHYEEKYISMEISINLLSLDLEEGKCFIDQLLCCLDIWEVSKVLLKAIVNMGIQIWKKKKIIENEFDMYTILINFKGN